MMTSCAQTNPLPHHVQSVHVAKRLVGLGFTTLLTQVLLIREASVWLRGNEFIIAAIVASWLTWVALGSVAGYRFTRHAAADRWLTLGWCCSVAVSVIELIMLRCFWTYTGNLPGESISLGTAAVMGFAATALPCVLSGSAFGAATRWVEHSADKTVAWLYLWETLGAVLAGVMVTFIFIPLQHWWFTLAVLILSPFLWSELVSARRQRVITISIVLVIVWVVSESLDHGAQRIASRFLTGSIVADRDAPRERLTVTMRDGEAAFFVNGRLVGSSLQKGVAEEIAWYSFLSVHEPERAALIGFPYNGLLRETVQKGLFVTVPDPEKAQLKALSHYLLPEDEKALTSSFVQVLPVDARVFMHKEAGLPSQKYDLVIQNVGIPESYAVARLYSLEWFRDVMACMSTSGAFVVVLPSSAGYVPDDLARIIARVQTTLKQVFPHVVLIPTSSTMLIATRSALPTEPSVWRAEWAQHATTTVWFSDALIEDNLNEFRVAQFSNACARFSKSALQTDMMPRTYGDALLYSEARFSGNMHRALSALYTHPMRVFVWLIIAAAAWCVVSGLSLCGRLRKIVLWLSMAAIAATGFIGEMTIVIHFAFVRGSAFYALGLLFAGFMLGLALATWAFHDAAPRMIVRLQAGASLVLCCVVMAAAFMPWPSETWLVTGVACILNMFCGASVGACFAAMARYARSMRAGGVTLYAGDVCGALIGGILFSVVVPPVLGFGVLAVFASCVVVILAIQLRWLFTE